MSLSQVATTTSAIFEDNFARRRTCSIMGTSKNGKRIFPGNRTYAIWAGIIAIVLGVVICFNLFSKRPN